MQWRCRKCTINRHGDGGGESNSNTSGRGGMRGPRTVLFSVDGRIASEVSFTMAVKPASNTAAADADAFLFVSTMISANEKCEKRGVWFITSTHDCSDSQQYSALITSSGTTHIHSRAH
jgi:hypothetical protein